MRFPSQPVPQPRSPLQHPSTPPRLAHAQRPKLLPVGFPSLGRPGRPPEGPLVVRPTAP